jgi:cadmium resistance protein CadD (predicted permease)
MEILLISILAFVSADIGQYLGIVTLIAASFGLSFIGLVIDKSYIGLLGYYDWGLVPSRQIPHEAPHHRKNHR